MVFLFGLDALDYSALMFAQWVIVFVINIVPAMAPPTWTVLSFFYITYPQDILILILIGVTASTCGRFALAWISGYVTNKFAGKKKKEEFNEINEKLQSKPTEKFVFTFLYALSPLPSNALFIAFGATKTRLREVLAGFFAGRFISYLFLVFVTQKVFSSLASTAGGTASYLTIGIEVFGVIAVIAFFFFDWKKLLNFEMPFGGKKREEKWPKKRGKKKK